MEKTLLVPFSDTHCGAPGGLTTEEHQWSPKARRAAGRWGTIQRDTRNEYKKIIEWTKTNLKPVVDAVGFIGDGVDGQNLKEGGVGQVLTDPEEQAYMCAELISWWEAKNYFFVHGSTYHTGSGMDHEALVPVFLQKILDERGDDARIVPIDTERFVKIGGKMIQARHHTGQTTVPYSFGTPLAKEWLSNLMWFMQDMKDPIVPLADLYIQAHIHAYGRVGGFLNNKEWDSFSLPALQVGVPHTTRTKFTRKLGARPIHWGVVPMLLENGKVSAFPQISSVKSTKAEVITIG